MRSITTTFLVGLLLVAPAARAQEADADAAAAARPTSWAYPQDIQAAGRRVSLYEPTLLSHDTLAGTLTLRFAVGVTDGLGRVTYGVADVAGTEHLDLDARLVLVDGLKVVRSAFPALPAKDRGEVEAALPDVWPKALLLRLEVLTAGPGAAPADPASPPKLNSRPPVLHVRRTPAVLVQFDGDPLVQPVGETSLEYVVNSASDLFRDPKTNSWFLLVDGAWAEAKAVEGPWKPLAGQLPVVLTQIQLTHPRGHVRRFVPGTPEHKKAGAPAAKPLPEILVSREPAELVLLRGDPLFTFLPGVKLMVVANTESDLFFHPKQGSYFLLVSGRWFQAEDLGGPWKEAYGNLLPEEFTRIPRDHGSAHVLACVPGTPEAAEAAARAALWERATFVSQPTVEVVYDGDPLAAALEGTEAKIVTNTEDDVFLVGKEYFVCARGAWFRSKNPHTEWKPALEVPEALRALPEASGVYHAAFCRALGATEDGPRFAVSGGYSGVFLVKGAPVHGTGWTTKGLLRGGNWYPSPRTYGENRWYDPATGVFQPRTVRYSADALPVADLWSPYTASYGRVEHYADRYGQGGRRMFPFTADAGFDATAERPDVYGRWGGQIKRRDGLKTGELPLGDRRNEAAPAAAVVADEAGNAWRLGAKGAETHKDGAWTAAKPGATELAWLEAYARLAARPAQWKAWAEKRRAPLPANASVTGK